METFDECRMYVYVWFSHISDLTQLISRIKFRHFLFIIQSPMFDIR